MEIPNRRELEARYAKRLGRMSQRHKHELRELLGSPPDPSNVPQSFWEKVRKEMEAENLTLLYLLFLASARYHAFGTYSEKGQDAGIVSTLNQQATGYSKQRAVEVGSSYADTSAVRFETLKQEIEQLKQKTRPDAPTTPPGTVTRFPDLSPADKRRIETGLDKVFGPGRASTIAISETTAAQSAGGDAGAKATFGLSLGDLWITEADQRVCPICSPLHRTRREFWGLKYVDGPPAHPNCRCVVKYAKAAKTKAA